MNQVNLTNIDFKRIEQHMSGTTSGGLLTKEKIYANYGYDHYRKIGALGGAKSITGGFFANRELASAAGRIGGFISRRGKGNKLSPAQKQRIKRRKAVQKAYEHLLKINQRIRV